MTRKNYRKRIIAAIATAPLMIALVGILRPAPASSTVEKDRFWAEKVHTHRRFNLILAGDSRIYRGFDPQTLEKKLRPYEIEALNFGFSAGGLNSVIYREIDEKLAPASDLRIVVLGVSPMSLTPLTRKNEHYLQEKNRAFDEVFLRRFIYPRLTFFEPISPIGLINSFRGEEKRTGYIESFETGGWVASNKIPPDPEDALDEYRREFEGNAISEASIEELMQQIRQWRRQGVLVYALRMPSTEKMEILENEMSGYNEEEIRRQVEAAGGEWLAVANRFDYYSYDGSHLEKESARKISGEVAELIKNDLDRKSATLSGGDLPAGQ